MYGVWVCVCMRCVEGGGCIWYVVYMPGGMWRGCVHLGTGGVIGDVEGRMALILLTGARKKIISQTLKKKF